MRPSLRLSHLVLGLQAARFPFHVLASHYACGSDEVAGEVQGETGVVCGPKCSQGTFDCATDVPEGTTAQPQCVLQDIDSTAYCGLLCQVDSQCQSGASCRNVGMAGISICIHPLSFSEWAQKQGTRKKLAVGWPVKAGNSARGFQIAKAYSALQSLKRRYGIADGDADVLTVKELLSATSAGAITALGQGAQVVALQQPATPKAAQPNGGDGDSVLRPWKQDLGYVTQNVRDGLPGLEREIHDTIWNVEHIGKQYVATGMLRGVIMIAVVYLVGGGAYKYQTMGARGLEMVPHIGFWMEYPQLVADGLRYVGILAGDCVGRPSARGGSGGFQASVPSDRDTFAHFEPSK